MQLTIPSRRLKKTDSQTCLSSAARSGFPFVWLTTRTRAENLLFVCDANDIIFIMILKFLALPARFALTAHLKTNIDLTLVLWLFHLPQRPDPRFAAQSLQFLSTYLWFPLHPSLRLQEAAPVSTAGYRYLRAKSSWKRKIETIQWLLMKVRDLALSTITSRSSFKRAMNSQLLWS